ELGRLSRQTDRYARTRHMGHSHQTRDRSLLEFRLSGPDLRGCPGGTGPAADLQRAPEQSGVGAAGRDLCRIAALPQWRIALGFLFHAELRDAAADPDPGGDIAPPCQAARRPAISPAR